MSRGEKLSWAFTASDRINSGIKFGRTACDVCSAMWNLCTNSPFTLGPSKITQNLDRVGRSQELPDAD
jgi:hypothetical protein